MNPFTRLQDIYLDAVNLAEVLKQLPRTCDCKDADAHLSGRCCCAGPRFEKRNIAGDEEGGCLSRLQKLNRSIEWFEEDLHQAMAGNAGEDVSRALNARLSLIRYLIDVLKRTVKSIEVDLHEFRITCAHAALEKLKVNSKALEQYADKYNTLLSAGEQSETTVRSMPLKDRSPKPKSNRGKSVSADPQEVFVRLKELGEKHQVCYEVWAETQAVDEQPLKVGFDLELYGTHEQGKTTFSPGCDRCVETFKDLREIAEWILPREEHDSYYEIEPFDNAIRELPSHKFRPEVVLKIKILHKQGFNEPVDACEERCLKEMQQKLAALGIRRGAWK